MFLLNIGDTIILQSTDEQDTKKLRSKVVDIIDEKVYIDFPVNDKTKKTEIVVIGQEYSAVFVGKDQSVYIFTTEIISKLRQQIPMIQISYPGHKNLRRLQRREFVRVDSSLDVSIIFGNKRNITFNTVTSDISAGGCAIILPKKEKLLPTMIIDMYLVLPLESGYKYLLLKGKVIRVLEGTNKEPDKVPVEFVNISEVDRQLIIRYCFEKQLEMRKRGIIS
jgi:c-di-GMP-binding flagellar brake protein YcgR